VRATANGFATGMSRVGAAIGTFGAPMLLAYSTSAAMMAGAGIAVLGCVVTFFMAPETSGMTLNESSAAVHRPRSSLPVNESSTVVEEAK
jgi:putative MFS transporter